MYSERYLEEYQNYKDGDYSYHTIKYENDINNAIKSRKIIVMPCTKTDSFIFLILTGLMLVLGLSITIVFGIIDLEILFIPISIFGFFVSFFFLFFLIKRREAFLIYGPEGIILKKRGEDSKEYLWEELSAIEVPSIYYTRKTFSIIRSNILHLNFSDGTFFEIDPFNFNLKEFAEFKPSDFNFLKLLVVKCFKSYLRSFRKTTPKETKAPVIKKNLMEIFSDYKSENYQFSSYSSFQALIDAYYGGKTFIFHGKPHAYLKILISICWFLGALMIFLIFLVLEMGHSESIIIYYLVVAIIFFTLPSLIFKQYHYLILINSKGFAYRKLKEFVHIRWIEVQSLHERSYGASSKIAVVLRLNNFKMISFSEINYNLNMFPKHQRGHFLFHTFKVYHTLAKKQDLF